MTADSRDDPFLRRWSRLKHEARSAVPKEAPGDADEGSRRAEAGATPAARPQPAAPPALPPVESLTLESDYRAFFHPKVEDGLRRAALKKLFSDPHFNTMDGLDVYIDDYSVAEPLSEAALSQLEQAKKILAWAKEDEAQRTRQQAQVDGSEDAAASLASAEDTLLQTPVGSADHAASAPASADLARKPE